MLGFFEGFLWKSASLRLLTNRIEINAKNCDNSNHFKNKNRITKSITKLTTQLSFISQRIWLTLNKLTVNLNLTLKTPKLA